MSAAPIYMDFHSTTPVDERVFEVMRPFFRERFGNASSRTHRYGRDARDAVEAARGQVAALIGAKPSEIIFTSGATEADNLAIKGVVAAVRARGAAGNSPHVITQATEHKAVIDACKRVEREGAVVTVLPVDVQGRVSAEAIAGAITDDTRLVSVMLANNEVGTVHDIAGVAKACRDAGVWFHCDAAQGLGYLDFDVEAHGVDLASLSAHKIYAPKGVGALYVRRSVQHLGSPQALIDGGGHENDLRSGTLNVPGIVGFGAACEIMENEGTHEARRLLHLRDHLYHTIASALEGVHLNGADLKAGIRHPCNLNVSFEDVEGARLILELSEIVAVSSGAACSSARAEPSYVLEAMELPKPLAAASVRFGLGRGTTEAEIERTAAAVIVTVERLRG